MIKKFTLIIATLMLLFVAAVSGACDPGIYDLAGTDSDFNYEDIYKDLLKDITLADILDADQCYNRLLTDLIYMKSHCCVDEKLAAMQSYTIMNSYGMADMAKETQTFTAEQVITKADLYDAIKLINFYANNIFGLEYNKDMVIEYTDIAITKCNLMLEYLE